MLLSQRYMRIYMELFIYAQIETVDGLPPLFEHNGRALQIIFIWIYLDIFVYGDKHTQTHTHLYISFEKISQMHVTLLLSITILIYTLRFLLSFCSTTASLIDRYMDIYGYIYMLYRSRPWTAPPLFEHNGRAVQVLLLIYILYIYIYIYI